MCVQAPHTFFDKGTGPLALGVFRRLGAACLAVSTVDRTLARTLVVVVGADYAGVRPVVVGSAAPSPTPSSTKPFDDVVNAGKPAVCAARMMVCAAVK